MENKTTVFNTGETPEELRTKYNPEGSVLRKAQLRMLDMLLYIDKVCREQGISYRLDGGNILGAVRHGGFIPWDDDVDIVVDMKNYRRLCKYLKTHPHPQYIFQNNSTDKNFHFWSCLRDTKSAYKTDRLEFENMDCRGVQIDIFSYEQGLNPKLHRFADKLALHNILDVAGKHDWLAQLNYNILTYIIRPVFHVLSWLMGGNRNYMHSFGCGWYDLQFPPEVLLPHRPIMFEGHEFPGPADPEQFLSILYHNYMDLPPEDKRANHGDSIQIWD